MNVFKIIIYCILVVIPAILFFPFWLLGLIGDIGKEGCHEAVHWLQSILMEDKI